MLSVIEALKAFKHGKTFAKAARELNISERQLVRWIKGEHEISPAWEALLKQRLGLE